MELSELAAQYRQGGEACRGRVRELERLLAETRGETERLRLRRRISLLASMAREAVAMSNYLAHYYERRDVYEVRKPVAARAGVSGSAAVYQAGRFL